MTAIPEEAVEAAYDVSTHLDITTSDIERILEAAAPHMLTRLTNYVINRAHEDGQIAGLLDAADEASATITAGDIAECAAHAPGESGRAGAVSARDSLYEDPAEWLRARAASLGH
jgi:hypothetical protein